MWPNYDVYQTRTDRVIPLVVLSPDDHERGGTDRRHRSGLGRAGRRPLGGGAAFARAPDRAGARDRRGGASADRRARRPVHDAGPGQGSRRRAADLLPDLRWARISSSSRCSRTSSPRAAPATRAARDASRSRGATALLRLRDRALPSPANGGSYVAPRFVTAEHWRLHQLFPDEMAHATQHFTDMVAPSSSRPRSTEAWRPPTRSATPGSSPSS